MIFQFPNRLRGPAGLFRDAGFATFLDGIHIKKVGFKIAGNGMRYIDGTENSFISLFGKREKYEIIAWYRDKKIWRDLIKHSYEFPQEISVQHPPIGSQSKTKYLTGWWGGKFGITKLKIFTGFWDMIDFSREIGIQYPHWWALTKRSSNGSNPTRPGKPFLLNELEFYAPVIGCTLVLYLFSINPING